MKKKTKKKKKKKEEGQHRNIGFSDGVLGVVYRKLAVELSFFLSFFFFFFF
jgi:hypothetical protein